MIPNIDSKTGIAFGVIHQNSILQFFADEFEAVYGPPPCPACNFIMRESTTEEEGDWICTRCKTTGENEDLLTEEPDGYRLDNAEYTAFTSGDCYVMITKSPYFTYARPCSPCYPNAGDLNSPNPDGIRTYTFAADCFDEGQDNPPVYRVHSTQEETLTSERT